jgi:hypothetical protein
LPNTALQLTPLRGQQDRAILEAGIGSTVFLSISAAQLSFAVGRRTSLRYHFEGQNWGSTISEPHDRPRMW